MIEITDDTYRLIAARLREEIACADWYNGSVELSTGGLNCRLVLTAIIYRRDEMSPEGPRRPISDVVPVWWEFSTAIEGDDDPVDPDHTYGHSHDRRQKGQCSNNFTFSELKPYLIDYD